MRTRPADVDEANLTALLADGWGVRADLVRYLPEGGGGHHWKVTDRSGRSFFVTVDDLDSKDWLGDTRSAVLQGLQQALGTAAALRNEPSLDFVVAPLPSIDNAVVLPLGSRYALSVYAFLVGQSYPFGPHTDPDRRAEVVTMLIALHCATVAVSRLAPPHHPTVGHRQDLDTALQDLDRPWEAGPFSEAARALVASHATELADVLQGFDRLVQRIDGRGVERVITHGEPHAANVMSVAGRLVLFDWDTAALAPPERDLWMVASDSGKEIANYSRATGRQIDPATMTMYRLRWDLDDIASAVSLFRTTHQRTEDTQHWWSGLTRQIGSLRSWHEALG